MIATDFFVLGGAVSHRTTYRRSYATAYVLPQMSQIDTDYKGAYVLPQMSQIDTDYKGAYVLPQMSLIDTDC